MNYLQGLRNAVEYVEEHILDEIDFDEVCKCAGMSKSSFLVLRQDLAQNKMRSSAS